ncbi:MAG: spore maturation protein A [Ruminococcus sp.]|nr:spore maturation protein A [Ruminococcus sp.]
MGVLLAVLCLISVICAPFLGTVNELSSAAAESAGDAVQLWLTLAGGMMFWSGLMRVAERCGIVDRVCRIIRPVLGLLMPDAARDQAAMKAASLNAASNLLGLGNAAVPFGLRAIKELERCRCSRRTLAVFILLNTASIQLIPMNIIMLRAKAGSSTPADCLVPVLLNSVIALSCGLVMAFAVCGGKRCSCSA